MNIPVHDTGIQTADLVIFMGQSNMAGRGECADASVCFPGHGFEYKAVTAPDRLCPVAEPFGKDQDTDAVNDFDNTGKPRRRGDMVPALMESYYSACGVPIVGTACSRGGTSTVYWTSPAVLSESVSRLQAAKSFLKRTGCSIRHTYMVWCQGETDGDLLYEGSETVDEYKRNTIHIVEYMRDNAGIECCFMIQTGHYNWKYTASDPEEGCKRDTAYVLIAKAQTELADSRDAVILAGSFLGRQGEMKDLYHYHQSAYNDVGKKAGIIMAEYK